MLTVPWIRLDIAVAGRQGKGFTQEPLAEAGEVSQRTIQRIESGEVDPRAYTFAIWWHLTEQSISLTQLFLLPLIMGGGCVALTLGA